MTMPPPRAGPNPDGEARQAGGEEARRANFRRSRSGELLTLLDFVRYARQPLRRSQARLRARHHRSRRGSRVPGLRGAASASRPVRELCHRARHRRGRQAHPRPDRPPRHHAQTGRLSRQQDLYARPSVLCRRARDRAALLHRRTAGFAFRRRRRRGRLADRRSRRRRKRARPLHRLGLPRHSRRAAFSRTPRSTPSISPRTRSRSPRATSASTASRTASRCIAAICSRRSATSATT